jgi:hypothetical protein
MSSLLSLSCWRYICILVASVNRVGSVICYERQDRVDNVIFNQCQHRADCVILSSMSTWVILLSMPWQPCHQCQHHASVILSAMFNIVLAASWQRNLGLNVNIALTGVILSSMEAPCWHDHTETKMQCSFDIRGGTIGLFISSWISTNQVRLAQTWVRPESNRGQSKRPGVWSKVGGEGQKSKSQSQN